MSPRIRWIRRFWRGFEGIFPVLLLLTFLSVGVTIAMPLIFMEVIDAAVAVVEALTDDPVDGGAGEKQWIHHLAWILLAVGAGRSLRNLYPMLRARMNCLIEMEIRRHYFRRILDKGHGFFLRFRTGDVVTRLTEDIQGWMKIGWYMCSGIFRAVESASMLIGCTIAMIVIVDWRLGLIATAPLPFMMLAFYWTQTALRRRFEESQRMISETNDILESSYSGIRIVKAYNAEARMSGHVESVLARRVEVEMGVARLRALLDQIFTALTHVGRILTIGFGGYWIIEGSVSEGELVAIYVFVDQLWRPMLDIPQLFVAGRQAFVCIDRLEEMNDFEREEEESDERGGEPVDAIESIVFEGVTFRYDGSRAAVDAVDLSLPRGRKLAVVGPVGSGKTTIARLLSGEFRPSAGRVLVNGRDLAEVDLADYRRRVGTIPQEALLFSDTVRENVSFGRGHGDDIVEGALRIAQVEAEVAEFPGGLDEMLGPRGVRVSGGQRQRLAIARAVIGDPDVLIMDDVTAALDAENEERLWDAIGERRKDVTAVLVTHRISTARRADEILVLDHGRVVDRGTHAELIGRCT
ncbi:MAG: ABC transporter ATP-binding protein, partial [Planctomycetota bacterium]